MLLSESLPTDPLPILPIGFGQSFTLGVFRIEVTQFIGQYLDVYYYQVVYQPDSQETSQDLDSESERTAEESVPDAMSGHPDSSDRDQQCLGLLRVGQVQGALQRESSLRDTLGAHRMIMPLVFCEEVDRVMLSLRSSEPEIHQESETVAASELLELETDELDSLLRNPNTIALSAENSDPVDISSEIIQTPPIPLDPTSNEFVSAEENLEDYLEEEEYEVVTQPTAFDRALIALSPFPDSNQTLAQILSKSRSLDSAEHERRLSLSSDWIKHLPSLIQLCQMANYLQRQGWCWVNLNPQWIELGQPIRLYDFIGIFRAGDRPSSGISGNYWPPELLLGHAIDEQMVSFTLGAILYHLVHGHPPQLDPTDIEQALEFAAVPGLHQVLRACLAQGDDRPSIAELLSMLVELQQQQQRCRVDWIQGSGSTLGLSDSRWTNEDSYGVRYQVQSPTFPTVIMGILADGMGGLEQGEVASQCAVQTLLTAPLPGEEVSQVQVGKTLDRWQGWLIEQIQDANQKIFRTIRNGGTTLSVVLGVADYLLIAHVGDSRIFLIRNGHICQLSEDHSLVQNLWVTGQISYAEMQDHPDRNVLLKSIGSRRLLKTDIQTLQKFGAELSLPLQYGDILLLCSDGVWDLVPPDELCEIFAPIAHKTDRSVTSLQPQIDQVLQRVIDRGAHDNATIMGLQCFISPLFS